jgi:hypothetical protein
MTLLTLIQGATDRIGVVRPTAVISSTDQQVRQLVGLAQQEGKELAKRHSWQALTKENTFTSVAAETQTSSVPSDFDRFIDDTFFNRTEKRKLEGPLSPQQWAFHKSVVATTLVEAFRQRGNDILITPTPTAGQTMAYEYVSTQWCESSGGTDQAAWAADTDVGLLPEELMTLGVVWRWQRTKGLDYAESFNTYEAQVAQTIARDGGKPTLNIGSAPHSGARYPFVPDGNWSVV